MSDRTLDILVASVMGLIALVALGFLINFAFTKAVPFISGKDAAEVEFVKKNGKWVVPESETPRNMQDLEKSGSLVLIPDRVEKVSSSGVDVSPAEQKAMAKTVDGFLSNWETFDPAKIAGDKADGKSNPYRKSIEPYTTDRDLTDLAERVDATEPSGACLTCGAGIKWMDGGDIETSLKVNRMEGNSAYVTVTGVVKYVAPASDMNPRNGSLILRSYGLILKKEAGKWVVSRAATDNGRWL